MSTAVVTGSTPARALRESSQLALLAARLACKRFRAAEHRRNACARQPCIPGLIVHLVCCPGP